MASMAGKRAEYLKRRHKKEGDIRLDNGKMLALLSELTIMKEEPMNSNDWVAEHVMGFERESCQGTMGGGNTLSDGTCETWVHCDWCGSVTKEGDTCRCPSYPFPKFTLVDLMQKLGEKGYHVMVRVDPEREYRKFTVTVNSARVCDTDSPLKSLCGYLHSKRELWQRLEEVSGPWHGPRKPEKKCFVSGEQVLEEYIAGHWRPGLELAHLTATFDMLAFRVKRLEKRFEALLEELPPEAINFRTI